MRSLLGSDILKYFNFEVNYDESLLLLRERTCKPGLSPGETLIQIYSVEEKAITPSSVFGSNTRKNDK